MHLFMKEASLLLKQAPGCVYKYQTTQLIIFGVLHC